MEDKYRKRKQGETVPLYLQSSDRIAVYFNSCDKYLEGTLRIDSTVIRYHNERTSIVFCSSCLVNLVCYDITHITLWTSDGLPHVSTLSL